MDVKKKAAFGLAWMEHERELAKDRKVRKASGSVPVMFPEQNGDTRDIIGERVGVTGKSIDKIEIVAEWAPEKLSDESSLEEAYRGDEP